MSLWKAAPSLAGRQFRPFVLGLPSPFDGPEELLLPAASSHPLVIESFLHGGYPPGHVAGRWDSGSGSVERLLGSAGRPDDTQESWGPSLCSPPSSSPGPASVSLGGAC